MIERPSFIVDASVVTRWYLNSPPYVDQARQVRFDYRDNAITLTAPDNLRVELGGAIHQAVFARRLRAAQGEAFYDDFLDWNLPLVDTVNLLRPAYRMTIRYGCSFYDAIYLALAELENVPFVHADQRLRNALGGRFRLELWIENYQSPRRSPDA